MTEARALVPGTETSHGYLISVHSLDFIALVSAVAGNRTKVEVSGLDTYGFDDLARRRVNGTAVLTQTFVASLDVVIPVTTRAAWPAGEGLCDLNLSWC